MNKKINLYLVRHGETDWNKSDLVQGNQDIPLNDNGIKQALEVAEILENYDIEYVYSSPLIRAFQTANIIVMNKNVNIEKVDNLKEICFGDYEGRNKKEIKEEYGMEFYNGLFHSDKFMDFKFINGETKIEAGQRFLKTVLEICKTTKYKTILVVAHGFVLNLFLNLNGFKIERGVKNCCVISCDYKDNIFNNIKLLNQENIL